MADRSAGRLLRASLRGDAWAHASPSVALIAPTVDPQAVALIASSHGVAGYVRAAANAAGTSPDLVAALQPAYVAGLLTHQRTLRDVVLVDDVLRGSGVPYVVLKGPVLATRTHARPDLRAYTDLDVLVPPPHFACAVNALLEAGCQPFVTAWRALRDAGAGEISLRMPSGGALDLHWHTLNAPELRHDFSVRPRDLVERSASTIIGSLSVPALDPADDLIYVAMHMVLSGADRLIWTKDVDLLIRGRQWSADEVVERAGAGRAGLVVAVALAHAASSIDTHVPAGLRRRLAGGSIWPAAAAAAARASGPGSASGQPPTIARVIAKSTRRRTLGSVRELSHRARAWREPRGMRPGERPADPDQATARAEFLDWVDAHAKSHTR